MINLMHAIFLGIVQGITEFLPISSSAHLVFFQHFLKFKEEPVLFDLSLHLGTLLAVNFFYREDLFLLIRSFFHIFIKKKMTGSRDNNYRNLLFCIIIATLPTALIGVIFQKYFEQIFTSVEITAILLFVTGIFLWISDRFYKKKENFINWWWAILIGFSQGLAIAPGISRSGITISTGLLLGVDKEFSAKFSFLISIPAVLGAVILKTIQIEHGKYPNTIELLVGILFSFFVGLIALKVLIKVLKSKRFSIFAYYCWGISILVLILNFWG